MLAGSLVVFLLDLDGAVYIGPNRVHGSAEPFAPLGGMGKTLRFLMDDPRPTRGQVVRLLGAMGSRPTCMNWSLRAGRLPPTGAMLGTGSSRWRQDSSRRRRCPPTCCQCTGGGSPTRSPGKRPPSSADCGDDAWHLFTMRADNRIMGARPRRQIAGEREIDR